MLNIDKLGEPRWYILHCYAGYENIVQANLEKLIENNNLQEIILDIKIPTEQVVEEKNGKRKVVTLKLMPNYVFVKMRYTNDIWYMVTNTRGVTGFVGPVGRAQPISEDEVRRLHLEKIVVDFKMGIGDNVKVLSGPLDGFIGEIKGIDNENQKVQVVVNMFGRETPVDLDFVQVEAITN
jgi:transcriptional antiterminator NusG